MTICEGLKNVVLESTARETYATLLALKPDSNTKRLEILKKVRNVDLTELEEHVIEM